MSETHETEARSLEETALELVHSCWLTWVNIGRSFQEFSAERCAHDIAAAIAEAVEQEREECAKIAERLYSHDARKALGVNAVLVASQIEKAIRAREPLLLAKTGIAEAKRSRPARSSRAARGTRSHARDTTQAE